MVSLGDQIAFFFIRFLNLAISYSVKRIHGACSLPGLASAGGGLSRERALLVDIPATALCTLVPTIPGTRVGRGVFCLGCFGGFGGRIRTGAVGRLREDAPTREVGIGNGEGGADSHSESVTGGGESGLGGGSTSPGTVTLRLRWRERWVETATSLIGRGPFSVRRAVPSVPLITVLPRVV